MTQENCRQHRPVVARSTVGQLRTYICAHSVGSHRDAALAALSGTPDDETLWVQYNLCCSKLGGFGWEWRQVVYGALEHVRRWHASEPKGVKPAV